MSMQRALRYYYSFRSSEGTVVSALRGEAPPRITDGSGGWEVVSRPRRRGLTLWRGRNPYAMDVPILFDGHAEQESVEGQILRLNRMSIGEDFSPPPTVKVSGGLPLNGLDWVIAGIEWGEDVFWEQPAQSPTAYRTRQDAVVHLLEHSPEVRVKIEATNTLPNIYIVTKGGETLRSISRAVLGNAARWTEIKALNPDIRDPNNLKIGTRVRIP